MAKLKISFLCEDTEISRFSRILAGLGVSSVVVSATNVMVSAKPKEVKKPIETASFHYDITQWPSVAIALEVFKNLAIVHHQDVRDALVKRGYAYGSSSSIIHHLTRTGVIQRMRRGAYRLTP